MQEAWDTAPDPLWVVWIATRQRVLTDRELRLFAVWCARQGQHLLTDPRSVNAIDVAERYANGEATDEELAAAWVAGRAAESAADEAADSAAGGVASWAAERAAASVASWAAASVASWATEEGAAWAAERTADGAAARAAAIAAERTAERTAAWAAARVAQAQWLRENTKPNFN
jgi:hypothetical protein